MNKDLVKKLAKTLAAQNKIDGKTRKFILENLSRRELARFSRLLEKIVSENSVRVISSEPLGLSFKKQLGQKFADKNIYYELNKSVGTGIKLVVNDTIIDLSLQNFLDNAIERLKS